MSRLKYVLYLLLFSNILIAQTPNTWTRVADFGGIARENGFAFNIDSLGYECLGASWSDTAVPNTIYPTDLWQYNPLTNAWAQKANFPGIGRQAGIYFTIGTKAYLGLGYNNSSQGLNDFWEYDPIADTWTQKANFSGGGRYFAVGFSIGGKGYVGMGYSDTASQYKKDIWEYDPTTDTWIQLNNFPGAGVSESFLFGIEEAAYIGFGYNTMLTELNDFWRFDPVSDTWIQLSDFAGNPVDGLSFTFNIQDNGYLNINYDSIPNDYAASGYGSYFWEYNAQSDTWIQKDSFIGATRQAVASFSIGNKAYAGTGTPYYIDNCIKGFWMYTPDSIATGIKNIGKDLITIYPNPTSDKLFINSSLTNASLSISDMAGQSWQVQKTGNEIDISALPSGVYCLRLQNGNSSLIRKFTKL
jgi:N-acetylneuraminic acid mutarotase